jgi:hypothetical protein
MADGAVFVDEKNCKLSVNLRASAQNIRTWSKESQIHPLITTL